VDFSQARPAGRTVIKLDADSEAIVPLQETEAGVLVVDRDLLEVHHRNVAAAIEYRARLLDALLNALKSFVK
jgi:hypothetical protein